MSAAPYGQDAPVFAPGPYQNTPLGYAQFTVGTTAQTLVALLAAAVKPYVLTGLERTALVSVESQSIRWIDDGQTPTTSYGQPIASGQAEQISTDFAQLQMVAQSGTATVDVSFYK